MTVEVGATSAQSAPKWVLPSSRAPLNERRYVISVYTKCQIYLLADEDWRKPATDPLRGGIAPNARDVQ